MTFHFFFLDLKFSSEKFNFIASMRLFLYIKKRMETIMNKHMVVTILLYTYGSIFNFDKSIFNKSIFTFIKSPKKKLAPNLGVSGIEDFKIPL